MPKLNLTTTTKEEQKVKAYLEANASSTLAEKINNGVHIQKDGKTLINTGDCSKCEYAKSICRNHLFGSTNNFYRLFQSISSFFTDKIKIQYDMIIKSTFLLTV